MTAVPIVINNINDLQAIQNNLSGDYVLAVDIDASGFNFTPIGSASNPFIGTFDGQGHTITNLTVNSASDGDTGLFADIGATGVVRNVGLTNENVGGFPYTGDLAYVGGLAGENFGTIAHSWVVGAVRNGAGVGLLVGLNAGNISESYSSGSVVGVSSYLGGLVGINDGFSAVITQSFSLASVGLGLGQSYSGGLVGYNLLGTISEDYARGTVEAGTLAGGLTPFIGGLVGYNLGHVTGSYAAGAVVSGLSTAALGGLIAGDIGNLIFPNGTATNSYWDVQTAGTASSAGGAGLTTSQLQSGTLPVGFDPLVWVDVAGEFPELRWQIATNLPPVIDPHSSVSASIPELPNVTGSTALDIANGFLAFADGDLNDRPIASVVHESVTALDAQGHMFQLADDKVFNFENAFLLVPESGNTNNGKIDWGYTIADKALDFLGVAEFVTITSTVELNDGHGGKADQDVTVVIAGANDDPIAKPDYATVEKGRSVTGNVLVNDTDPDIHDALLLHVTKVNGLDFNVGQPIHGTFGTLTLNVDGGYAYTANSNLGAAASGAPMDTFSYTLSDGHGGSSTTSLNVGITVSDRPASVNNTIKLTDGLVAVEMIKLATDAYPFGDTGYHTFDPLGTPLSATNPTAVNDIQADNWQFISASALHLNPSTVHGPNSIQYSFNNGFYQAIRASDTLGNDPSEADAIVLTGIVNGQKTLAIAFAGTDQKSDWMDFANFSDHYAKFGPLVAAVKQYIDSGAIDQVLVSGHSLGAAMAQDFMKDPIFKNDPHFHALAWTIGSPGSDNISQDAPDARITNFYHTLDPIYELTHPLSLFAELVRSSGSFVQQQFFKDQLQDFFVNSPYGFSSSEARIVANNLLSKMLVKAHEGTDVEIPFGEPATHIINNFGTNIDFDAHDQVAYLHDVETYLTGLSQADASHFLLHI
ncbi:VCBS repeat-containing protein [Bradyrhizobium sp. Rc2d]|uniref:Ig-like domain-containing protein n=1 Tax=Bradyrhizobium sp. Rc2d TaxID=1855321 RepID=UPI0008814FCF|nr:Ig-like domain-containing protein [Bradyrhizobium sp. Rc2d]SDG44391.1 VCBS repeat-containing protein [Bradyrhizobium sp. Rc2d]